MVVIQQLSRYFPQKTRILWWHKRTSHILVGPWASLSFFMALHQYVVEKYFTAIMSHLFWIIHRTYCQMDFFFSAKHFNNMSVATKTLFLKRHADTEIVKCVFRSFEHAALCCHRGRNTDKAVRLDTTIGKKEFKFRRQKQYYVGIFQFIFFRSIIMYKIIRIQVNKVTYNDLWFVVLY